jgi:AraC-like DNA-binding protein
LAAFRIPDAPRLITRSLFKSASAFTEVRGEANHGITAPIPFADAYLIQLRLLECPQCDYFVDGKHLPAVDRRAGIVQIHDLQCNPMVDLRDPFHVLHFYLPRKMLEGISGEMGAARVSSLLLESGRCFEDPALQNLLLSIHPALACPEQSMTLFTDHVALAISVHLVQQYGGVHPAQQAPRGGLAPWQERRAIEMLEADLTSDVSLVDLASECRVSVRHFSRAFRISFGMPAHRYLMKRRVGVSRQMLLVSSLSLHDVALACGFADQSHFTRIFKLFIGISPGEWRRSRIS